MNLLLIVFVISVFRINSTQSMSLKKSVPTQKCTQVSMSQEEELAYIGWPFQLDCSVFFREPDYTIYDIYEDEHLSMNDKMLCFISYANGTVLLNSTLTYGQVQDHPGNTDSVIIPDLKQGDPLEFRITLTAMRISKCLETVFRINLVPFSQTTCENFTSSSFSRIPSKLGHTKYFHCIPSQNEYPRLYSNENLPNMTYTWWRNCSSLPSDVTAEGDNNLIIPSVSYEDAGLYTCSVTYNGMTRFVTSYPVCVQQPGSLSQQTITCNQEVYYRDVGSDIVLECTGNFGDGTINQHQFRASWKKKSKNASEPLTSCRRSATFVPTRRNKDMYCTYDLEANKCYMHVANEEERKVKSALLPIRLYIKNAQPSDFGEYVISLSSNLLGSKLAKKTVILQQRQDSLQVAENFLGLTGYQIIGICVGVFALIVVVILSFYCMVFSCLCNCRKRKQLI